jgi:hypothetical protein
MLDVIFVSRVCNASSQKEIVQLNLLAIEWSETVKYVARRVGCCRVDENDWVKKLKASVLEEEQSY